MCGEVKVCARGHSNAAIRTWAFTAAVSPYFAVTPPDPVTKTLK